MARNTNPEAFAALVDRARQVSPDIAITTDIITGFPGETEAEFEESLAFVRSMEFAAGHVFTYSARPGTAAARLRLQIPMPIGKQRNARMRALFEEAGMRYQRRFRGAEMDVLWESTSSVGPQGWELQGLTDNYLKVHVHSPQPLWNNISKVELTNWGPEGYTGRLVG
jgi:threonylcarbamoyladenosine tRNA methylthiotransferase MtaB